VYGRALVGLPKSGRRDTIGYRGHLFELLASIQLRPELGER
jgi:hypothetical protein